MYYDSTTMDIFKFLEYTNNISNMSPLELDKLIVDIIYAYFKNSFLLCVSRCAYSFQMSGILIHLQKLHFGNVT